MAFWGCLCYSFYFCNSIFGENTIMKKESKFQRELIEEIETRFPGSIVLKNDADYIQGIPDLTVLWGKHWAVLECKRYKGASRQPNQPYYVKLLDGMSFSRFVEPSNKEEVLNAMEQTFRSRG